jgi:hypothetical protein
MRATFTVPPAPKTWLGGTVYLFPGSEPDGGYAILQPVLQYGPSFAGGNDYWAIGSYFCCYPGHGWAFASKLLRVNPGDTIVGTMTSECPNSHCNWTVTTENVVSGERTTLNADNVPWPFVWQFGGVLEAYYLEGCDEYPQAPAVFRDLVLKDHGGRLLRPEWKNEIINPSPPCKYGVESTPSLVMVRY